MAPTHSIQTGLAAVVESRRKSTDRSLRNLADETLIPLTTLHRKIQTGDFTPAEIERLAIVFDIKASDLLAEAEAA